MDKIPESANGESIIFEMDLDIQEDVDACLAEFVFLVRLDLHEDARHLAEDILWRHIGYFPVFAELAAFFITIQDVQATSDLISDLAARRIVFAGIDEQEFLRMVDLFAQNRLSASTLAAFPQKEKLKLEGPDAVGALYSPFLEIDYSSIAQLQNVEIRLYNILVVEQHEKLPDVVEFATDYIQKLFEFRLLREATEIFLYLCIHLHNTGQKYDILSLYNNLSEWLEQRWKTSTTNNEIKDVLLTKKTVKTALFIAIRGKIQSPPVVGRFEDIDGLVQEIEELNNILFSMIADMKPSRSLSDSLHERWHVRKHPPLLREDVSIHPESPRILRSTLDNYGVWKAHPKRYDVERGGTRTPHLTLYFGNNEGIDFRAAINIKSGDQPESRLVYWVNEDMSGHPLVRGLSELKTGFERLDHKEPERGRLRLDYIRGNFFNVNTGRVLGHDITGPNNDIIDVLVPKVQQAINEGAVVYIFGERFNTNDGIHNVHMNQGNIRRYWGEDGVFQDGALLFHFPAADKWVGIFLAFASQAVHTSENGGHAISQVTWKDLLPGDLVKNPVASNSEPTPQGTDELVSPPALPAGPSNFQAQWEQLSANFDPKLLADLRRREPSAHSLYEIEVIINGLCRGVQRGQHLNSVMGHAIVDVDATQERAKQFVANTSEATREMRRELGWNVREFDISLLRQIRRSSALSLVLGAGASMAAPCNAPSWPALVEGLLRQTIGRVMELWLPKPQDLEQLAPEVARGLVNERFTIRDPVESAGSDWTPTFDYSHTDEDGVQRNFTIGYYRISARRYNAEEENIAVEVLQRIKEAQRNDQSVDADILMRGADVCHDLCGQRLFTLMTTMLYEGDRMPSEIHRAIARLARSRFVRERGDHFMGWDGIITYNYDDFMEQALSDLQIPSTAFAMRGDEIAGDPNRFARSAGPGGLYLPVYHPHGYTPRRPFLITSVPFVFATSGYQSQYGQSVAKVLERFKSDYLENPVHVALYVGCSFSDKYMNRLLQDAFERWPGRYHYALLPWPGGLANDQEPSGQEIEQRSGEYLAMGIRPIWLRNFGEIPHIISQLE